MGCILFSLFKTNKLLIKYFAFSITKEKSKPEFAYFIWCTTSKMIAVPFKMLVKFFVNVASAHISIQFHFNILFHNNSIIIYYISIKIISQEITSNLRCTIWFNIIIYYFKISITFVYKTILLKKHCIFKWCII